MRALVEAKHPRFLARFAEAFRAFPGAAELLARRATRGPVGIVSGALYDEITFALDRMGVRDSVDFIVSAEHTAAHKPDPAPYLQGMEELRRLGHDGRRGRPGGLAGRRRLREESGLALRRASPTPAGTTSWRARGPTRSPATSRSLTDALLEG